MTPTLLHLILSVLLASAAAGSSELGEPTARYPVEKMGGSSITAESVSELPPPAVAIKGSATWFDAPSRTDAAAGPLLREMVGSGWRGSWVTVCGIHFLGDDAHAAHGCVTVQLTDWCKCSKGRRLIDLDDRAFRRLAPLSRGVINVTVELASALPATDTETPPRGSWWGHRL